ncbi:MAG: hypothetical protein H7235_12245 [Bdellovibrionaceae bacterium]|nr:hypothetical protein [Pseudobdellovibrionaceae bacterium]
MKYITIIFLNLIGMQASASRLVQVPEQCLDKEVAPCLVRALSDSYKETSSSLKFYLGEDALLKITQFPFTSAHVKPEQFKAELLKGKVVILNSAKVPFYLNTVNVGLNETYYIKKNDHEVELYKSGEAVFFNITKNDDMDLVETKDFASRKNTTDFINQFTNIPTVVQERTLAQYETRLTDEVQTQKRVLLRKIASEDLARKLDAEARQKQKIESKRIKDMFFMRTFEK